jgi:hypothetical protein
MLERRWVEEYRKKLKSLPFVSEVEVRQEEDLDLLLLFRLKRTPSVIEELALADRVVEVNREVYTQTGEYPAVEWEYVME